MVGSVAPTVIPNLNLAAARSPNGAINPAILAGGNGALANPYATGALGINPYMTGGLGYGSTDAAGAYSGSSGGYGASGGYGESAAGGYFRGTAQLITSQGTWMVSSEQARLTREQMQREKIENRKRLFDEYLHEQKNTPSFEEERQRTLGQELTRSLNDPPTGEILSGQALNTILSALVRAEDEKGSFPGSAIALDENAVHHLNLTAGPGNPGLLRNEGRLDWPIALMDDAYQPERQLLDSLAPEAIRQAASRGMGAGLHREMTQAVQRLRNRLTAHIRELSSNRYIEAQRFVTNLGDALRVLARPDASKSFLRKSAVLARTVAELVAFMKAQGLHFAPAVPGDETAYLAVHRALVAAGSAAGMQATARR
jgi:hypothetical protein